MPYTRELDSESGLNGSPMGNSQGVSANVLLRARCKVQGVVIAITAIFAIETGEVGKISR